MKNGKHKILWLCHGCCIQCGRKSFRDTCFSIQLKKFGMQRPKSIPKWEMQRRSTNWNVQFMEQLKGSGMSQPIFLGFVHCGRTRSLLELPDCMCHWCYENSENGWRSYLWLSSGVEFWIWSGLSSDIGKWASSISSRGICLCSKWWESQRYHAHSSSQERSALVTTSHRTGKGDFKSCILMLFKIRRPSCFVITATNHAILLGDSMVALLEVEEVMLVEVFSIRLIIHQPVVKHLLQVKS